MKAPCTCTAEQRETGGGSDFGLHLNYSERPVTSCWTDKEPETGEAAQCESEAPRDQGFRPAQGGADRRTGQQLVEAEQRWFVIILLGGRRNHRPEGHV